MTAVELGDWQVLNNTIVDSDGGMDLNADKFDSLTVNVSGNFLSQSPTGFGSGILFAEFPDSDGSDIEVIIEDNHVANVAGTAIYLGSLGSNSEIDYQVHDNAVGSAGDDALSIENFGSSAGLTGSITGNRLAGAGRGALFVQNRGSIAELSFLIEGNELLDSNWGLAAANWSGDAAPVDIDAGGGASGSEGGNRIVGNNLDSIVLRYAVSAKDNWWGSATGPDAVVEIAGGSVDFTPFLTEDPEGDDDDGSDDD